MEGWKSGLPEATIQTVLYVKMKLAEQKIEPRERFLLASFRDLGPAMAEAKLYSWPFQLHESIHCFFFNQFELDFCQL